MVLDPMSAVSLASSIIQFIDFSSKIVSKGRRIYLSSEGALPKNLELGVVTSDLSRLAGALKKAEIDSGTLSEEEKSLQNMSEECRNIADNILQRLEKLKVKSDATHRGWKSVRQALKSVWSKEELEELSARLWVFRDQLQFHVLISMRERMERIERQTLQILQQSDDEDDAGKDIEARRLLKSLANAKTAMDTLLKNQEIFKSHLNKQTITITDLHLETRAFVQKEALKTRTEILEALNPSGSISKDHDLSQKTATPNLAPSSWNQHLKIQEIILQSLCFPTMNDRYEAIIDAHTETFEWIFQKFDDLEQPWDDFSDWLQNGDGIYWISGKAGSGKSTLMRYIKDNPQLRMLLQQWTGGSDLVVGTFFFWISGVAAQSSQVGLLRSLLFTILSTKPHLIEATFSDFWSNLRSSISPIEYSRTYSWTLARVTSCFKQLFSLISQGTGHVFLLIDGLDEYQGNPADTITLLQSVASPKVKICVSSRPWQVFKVAFKKAPKFQLQDLTFRDIKRYVDDTLLGNEQMQELCDLDPIGAPKLVEEIVEKAAGVFLWVTLVVKSFLHGLTNGDSISYLRKRLEEMPSEIENLYSYMLSQIQPIYYEEGRILFSIVWFAFEKDEKCAGDALCALRLSLAMENIEILQTTPENFSRESRESIISTVDLMDSRLKICCAGLIEISSHSSRHASVYLGIYGNRRVQYIHRTARDFLAPECPDKPPSWTCRLPTDDIPIRMIRANITYIQSWVRKADFQKQFREFIDPIVKGTLWLACMAEREKSYHHEEILDAFADSVDQHFDSPREWVGYFLCDEDTERSSMKSWSNDFLCLAIIWKLDLYLEQKLGQGKKTLEAKKGRPYLDYALRYMNKGGHPEELWDLKTISVLLEHGGNPNLHYSVCSGIPVLCLKQSTPWEAVLYTIENYSGTHKGKFFSSIAAPLFQLLINHGADLYATTSPQNHGASRTFVSRSVADVVFGYHRESSRKCEEIVALLEVMKHKPPPKRASRLSLLMKKLHLGKDP